MNFKIVYDSPSRLRLRCGGGVFQPEQEAALTSALTDIDGVCSVSVSSVNGGILLYYNGDIKDKILKAASELNPAVLTKQPLSSAALINAEFKRDFFNIIKKRLIMKFFVPSFLSLPLTVIRAVPFVKEGLKSLSEGKVNVSVLDAVSISASILSGSPSTASSVMTLLNISSLLESYTRKKAKNALSDSLSLNIDKVWRITDDTEELVPLAKINCGDVIRVRQGSMIAVDGTVKSGSAEVNEASLTGESIPREKSSGMTVYAGTVVEQGEIDITVSALTDNSRISNIIDLIENSEELKSGVQTKAESFADRLVPFSLITSAAAYLLTGNLTKALSVLMVDYSCAIKLSTPICVISAMKEATAYDIMIKGGRFLENYAFADTVMFDKTGTLTVSCPHLAKVIPFGEYTSDRVLTIAACLEEHFPHSVAKSIVKAAEGKGLEHREEHNEVKYIVAHGIASDLNGERALIGSAHFIFDDEKISISDEQRALVEDLSEKYSLVYLAVGGALCGILCIEDPIRKNAAAVIDKLKKLGMNDIIMITGDGESTAANVCRELGIEKHYAKVLPEDKLNIVNDIKSKNHKVIMVGDGINDSPALAAADVSVAMKDASDIAREVADITLLSSNLDRLVILRRLSENLFDRIHSNYRFISTFNSALILLGLGGMITPVASALLHNVSTMGICLRSMRPLLSDEIDEIKELDETNPIESKSNE